MGDSPWSVVLDAVSFRYPTSRDVLFQNLTFGIGRREIVGILGPSGSGKSTLLKLLAGLEKPSHGEVKRAEESAGGFVFQSPVLLDWLSVLDNVIFPERRRFAELERAKHLLAAVKLADSFGLFPRQLSGGMRSRVQLARALYHSPTILYLDEAFSAVDERMRHDLNALFLDLQQQFGFSAALVSHSVAEAATLSNRLFEIRNSSAHASVEQVTAHTMDVQLLKKPAEFKQVRRECPDHGRFQ